MPTRATDRRPLPARRPRHRRLVGVCLAGQVGLLAAACAPTMVDSRALVPAAYPEATARQAIAFLPFVGAGTEYALGDVVPLKELFWRTEYRYTDYGSHFFLS